MVNEVNIGYIRLLLQMRKIKIYRIPNDKIQGG